MKKYNITEHLNYLCELIKREKYNDYIYELIVNEIKILLCDIDHDVYWGKLEEIIIAKNGSKYPPLPDNLRINKPDPKFDPKVHEFMTQEAGYMTVKDYKKLVKEKNCKLNEIEKNDVKISLKFINDIKLKDRDYVYIHGEALDVWGSVFTYEGAVEWYNDKNKDD